MREHVRNHTPEAVQNARRLHREMTASEKVLWECVRKERLGFGFKRQVPLGPYTLDFYCPEAGLCVEVDGEQHDSARDERRGLFLEEQGILTIRVRSLDLFDARALVAEQALRHIQGTCERRSGRKAP